MAFTVGSCRGCRGPVSVSVSVSVALLSLLAWGCSRDDAGASASASSSSSSASTGVTRVASCERVTSMSVCSEYGALAQNEAVLAAQCAKLGGAFVGGPCPNTSVVGACTLSTGEVRHLYASGGVAYDAARAAKECASYHGTFRGYP